MLLLAAPAPAQDQWIYNTNGGAISIGIYSGSGGEVVIPATMNGLPVTRIGPSAFNDCTNLTSVIIPDTVTNISGLGGGYYSSFGAFTGCTGLTNVTFGANVANIGPGAFQGCTSLANVTLPASLSAIEFSAFSGCTSLASIHIPKNVSSIQSGALSGCTGLVEITVDPENASYSSVDGVLFDRSQTLLLQYPGARPGAYGIPQTVLTVNNGAFEDCVHVTSVWIPAGASNIMWGNFVGCSSLAAIDVAPDNSSYASLDGVLFDKSHTTLIRYPAPRVGSYTIPQGVERISFQAFQGCGALTGISIPATVTNVEYRAFYGCVSLASVTIPNSVTYVGSGAFGGCTALTNVALSEKLEDLPQGIFENCTSLSSIKLPEGLTRIGSESWEGTGGTFQNCGSLRTIQLPQSLVSLGEDAFFGCSNLMNITLPTNLATIYWGAFARCGLTEVVIPDKVAGIGSKAFAACPNLRQITVLPSNPTYSSVDGMLFDKSGNTLILCPGATAVCMLPNSVGLIGSSAFSECVNLSHVTIPSSVTNIGAYAFSGCVNLTNLTLPNSVKAIDHYAFRGCANLTDVTIPNSVNYFGEGMFEDCTSLQTVAIPSRLQAVPAYAFSGCNSLTNVTIPNSVYQIGYAAFEDCTSLEVVALPSSLQDVTIKAFSGCTSLRRVTIPQRVTTISQYAFEGCLSLTGLYFEGNAPRVGPDAFIRSARFSSFTCYYLPNTVGWRTTFAGQPTALWLPEVVNPRALGTNAFGFGISWASGRRVVIQACTNLANPEWTPLQTNVLTGGSCYFSDPEWLRYPGRFYRVRQR